MVAVHIQRLIPSWCLCRYWIVVRHSAHRQQQQYTGPHTQHTTHNTQHTTHNTQHTHNTQYTTHITQHTTHKPSTPTHPPRTHTHIRACTEPTISPPAPRGPRVASSAVWSTPVRRSGTSACTRGRCCSSPCCRRVLPPPGTATLLRTALPLEALREPCVARCTKLLWAHSLMYETPCAVCTLWFVRCAPDA